MEALSLFLWNVTGDNDTWRYCVHVQSTQGFILVAVTAENPASHRYDVRNGNSCHFPLKWQIDFIDQGQYVAQVTCFFSEQSLCQWKTLSSRFQKRVLKECRRCDR